MKNEEDIISSNNNSNKNIISSLTTYNSFSNKDFQKINSSNNIINTTGSHPIVIFKKISKSLTQTFINKNKNKEKKTKKDKEEKEDNKENLHPSKNNYSNNDELMKRVNKYKSVLSNPHQVYPTSGNISKNNKISKGSKTMRNVNKKLIVNKKEKLTKSKEKTQIYEKIKINNEKSKEKTKSYERKNNIKSKEKEKKFSKRKVKAIAKNKDQTKTEYDNKESHSQGHFNRKNKMFNNNFISKSINGISNNISNSNNNLVNNVNSGIINNVKIQKYHKTKKNKKDVKKKEVEEQEKIIQDHRKTEYIDALIKNGILNITKEFNLVKKLTPKEIISKKKRDFLKENGITELAINSDEKTIKYQPQFNINNISMKSIRKKNIATKNSIKAKANNKLNISKSNSRHISFLNNNTNNNINFTNTNIVTNPDIQVSSKNLKKKSLKPQINQFEYLNKIQKEQKKLPGHKNDQALKGVEKLRKYLKTNDNDSKLLDSFRHTTKIYTNKSNNLYKENQNFQRNSVDYNHLKKEKRQKLIEEFKDDEFPFSHRKSYRSPQEIYKYLREKRIESKKEEENTEKEKQLKAYMTFQNLMNIGKKFDSNITKISPKYSNNIKNRKESKGHMKLRKEPNEYYVGTESSKNNSTFIDKKDYYISILESQKYVNKSKIKQDEENEKEENNENTNIQQNVKEKTNKIKERKLKRGFSAELFDNKKIMDELYITINKANQIFSKENLNKIKNNLLQLNTDMNKLNNDNENLLITTENEDNINNFNNIDIANNINYNDNILKTEEIIIGEPITKESNINNKKSIINNINNNNNYFSYNFSSNNLNVLNPKEKINPNFSQTYTNSIKQNKKNDIKLESGVVSGFFASIKLVIKRNIFTSFYKKYLDIYKRKTYIMALNCIVAICKIYPFKQIEKHSRIIEYYEAFKELFKPFLHSRFRQFVLNCLELKMRRFIFIIETFYKYKAMNILFVYCERDFKTEIINFLINVIKKPFINYFFYKLKLNKNQIQNNNKNKISISFSNILINQIISQNQTKFENKSEEKQEINLNENPLIDEVLNEEENNIFNSSSDYYSLNHRQSKNIHSIKPMKKDEEINTHISIKDLIISDNNNNININNLKKLPEIKNPEEFSDILTNIIIENLIKTEIKPFSPSEKIVPYKSFKYDILPRSQNTSLNNSYISSSCASLDQMSMNNNSLNDPRIMSLNESFMSQLSYNSEFNKTIKDKKREQAIGIYVQKIGPKLIELICDEIKKNYNSIYDNISTPLRTNFEEIIVALELKDNEQLKQNYRILKVKKELKDIISREKIINKFGIINKKIRKKYNQDNIDESFDIFLNLSVIDTAIELINKERIYGEIGEPYTLKSIRTREIMFKYNRNEPKKLVELVYKSLMEYLNNPIFLIKDSVINADEKKIIKCFKKDLEENECQWEDMEIVETQSKLEVNELILDQLYNEMIEILEHVQLSRKRPELYQNKSIYACEDIPKLSFQMTTTENDLIQEGEGRDIICP